MFWQLLQLPPSELMSGMFGIPCTDLPVNSEWEVKVQLDETVCVLSSLNWSCGQGKKVIERFVETGCS